MSQFFNLNTFVNAILFQVLWFAAVIGSAKLLMWPSLIACSALAVWQLNPSRRHTGDLKLIGVAIILGLISDTLVLQLNLFQFIYPFPFVGVTPLWILLMWIGLAMTINHSLKFISRHPLLPPLLGAIFAPLSYLAGLRLGAVEYLADPLLVSVCIAFIWAIAMTILARISIQ